MSAEEETFLAAFRGDFRGVLRWENLAGLWEAVRARGSDAPWYIYAVGEPPPSEPAAAADLEGFLAEVDRLLRAEHQESYCGVVYADDLERPSLVKIYDPNHLGSVCGPGLGPPPLPGWVLSTRPPVDLEAAMAPPANRRRWWRRLFGG